MSDPKRCLWISRYIPYPLDEGAKVYSANLARSLSATGISIRFMGFGDATAARESGAGIEWLAVPGSKRSRASVAFNAWPIAAAIDATKDYGSLLDAQLRESWDAIVLDGYGAGWALDRCLAYRDAAHMRRPVLVHISHNHEESLWRLMAREARGSALRRFALRRNAAKVGTLERRLVRNVDLLTAITEEDRLALTAGPACERSLSLTPGYDGMAAGERSITGTTPRRVIIVGSFQWVVKQENLARFVELADPVFKRHGIELDIVGEVPRALLSSLRVRCRATSFHGFVRDVGTLLSNARIAVVPESIGGGFKLKFLDYIFGRIPVATLSQAAAGLPEELRRAMLSSDCVEGLIAEIVSHIDRLDELNRMQERAFALGKIRFEWRERGERLRQAIEDSSRRLADRTLGGNARSGVQDGNLAVI
jgi:polysaccharide biosynthesis protein PslH